MREKEKREDRKAAGWGCDSSPPGPEREGGTLVPLPFLCFYPPGGRLRGVSFLQSCNLPLWATRDTLHPQGLPSLLPGSAGVGGALAASIEADPSPVPLKAPGNISIELPALGPWEHRPSA